MFLIKWHDFLEHKLIEELVFTFKDFTLSVSISIKHCILTLEYIIESNEIPFRFFKFFKNPRDLSD